MAGKYGANQYKQTAVKTANRGQILLMLYEAAMRNVKKAMECIDQGDLSGKGVAIGKTHDIVNELTNSLDFEIGGSLAGELERLYNFMVEQLVKANLENSREPLEATYKLLDTLYSAWKVAVEQYNREQAANPAKKASE